MQWQRHVRDSDSVRLRENVTRRRIQRRPYRGAILSARARLAGLLYLGGSPAGATGGDRPNEDASLLLDFTPNAVHAGIYLATERDYDEAEGVDLDGPARRAPRPTR